MKVGSALALLAALPALHAAHRAQLAGRVEDPSGAALVEVVLSAVNEDTGIRRTTRTDATGQYAVGALEPGIYKVTARKAGFQTVARLNVELVSGAQTRLDFILPLGGIREIITVEEAPRDSQPGGTSIGVTARRRLIDTLPLDGRGTLTLVELAPGVVATPAASGEAGQFSVNGQRANTNYFSLDGVSANSAVTGSAAPAQFSGGALPSMTAFGGLQNLAALDSLQEVEVETSSFAPESGRLPGAQVRLSTRSGSNGFHGSLSYAFRNERLAANDWFAAARGYGRAPLRLNQWAGALGGPIRRDRTFFFAAWEGLRLRAPFTWWGATPSAESRRAAPAYLESLLDGFPLPTGGDLGGGLAAYTARGSNPSRLDSGSLRIDHALTPHVALFGRYSQAPSATQFGYQHVEDASFHTRSLTLGVNAAWAAGITNEARLKIAGDSVNARWLSLRPEGDQFLDVLNAVPFAGSAAAIYGISIGGAGQLLSGATDGNRQGQLHLVESLGWTRNRHVWRAGIEYQRLTPSREQPATAVAGYWPDLANLLSGGPMQLAVTQADQASSLIETLSLYGQDTWRPSPRLALTYGLRWEITPAPSIRQSTVPVPTATVFPAQGGQSVPPDAGPGGTGTATPQTPGGSGTAGTAPEGMPLWPTRYAQIAPRLGAAWRLSDRSVLRAGWGLFYDLAFSVVTDPINGFPFNRWQFGDIPGAPAGTATPQGPGYLPNLRLPYSHEWNLAWEQSVTSSDVVFLSYIGSAGRRLLRREAGIEPTGAAAASIATNHGLSGFHALEAAYRRRLARGVEALANYTWGHSIDNGSWDSAVALVTPAYTAVRDRGNASFDVRHSFSGALTYGSRGLGPAGFWRRLSSDWKLQAISRARSGFPIDLLEGENALGLGWDNYRRPDLVPGVSLWSADAAVAGGRRLNGSAFRSPGAMQGSLGRNAISGFGMVQADAALRRRFPLADSASVEIGLTCFNLANHATPADPVRYRNSPLFGQPASLVSMMLGNGTPRSGLTPAFQPGTPRSLELTVKLRW